MRLVLIRGLALAALMRWRDGLFTHFKGYTLREEALGDLGVSEDEFEPIAP